MPRKKYFPSPGDRKYNDDDLLDTYETTAVLKCGITKLYELRKSEELAHVPMGSRIFYLYKDLKDFINKRRRPGK